MPLTVQFNCDHTAGTGEGGGSVTQRRTDQVVSIYLRVLLDQCHTLRARPWPFFVC